jgi:hypothetical protein
MHHLRRVDLLWIVGIPVMHHFLLLLLEHQLVVEVQVLVHVHVLQVIPPSSVAYCFYVPQPIAAFLTHLFIVLVAEKVFRVAAVLK